MSTWRDMNAVQRNHLIGELIGAKPLSQVFLAVDGKRVRATPYTVEKRAQVDALLLVLQSDDASWAEFKRAGSDVQDEWRTKLAVEIEEWHMRYSDTPGGAWVVIEWLRKESFVVTIECHGLGWDLKALSYPHGVLVTHTGTDFARNACELLLKIKAPEVLT